MCGIAGLLLNQAQGSAQDLAAQAAGMAGALAYRGPDDSGIWVDAPAGIALGHRRLSILDLSTSGRQPMTSPSGRFVIVLNGEIYNFPALRRDLDGSVAWRGHSDTEVLLAAFDRWGLQAALERAVGMFACGIWDRELRQLTLVRDRLGEKPLYFGSCGDGLVFASELKAFRAHPRCRWAVDREALQEYVQFGWIGAPRTIFRDCRKLVPGHFVQWSAGDSWPPVQQPYWSLSERLRLAGPLHISDTEATQELQRLLLDAVEGQMLSDVPLGAFLSGGLDSTLVVALMQRLSPRPVQTFTIGFREAGFDEVPRARAVAQHLATEHTELYVSSEDARAVIPRLADIYDEPFADSSQIPTVLLAQLARKQVTVSLSGDGGDELFGGYRHYLSAARAWRQTRWAPFPLARAVGGMLGRAAWPGFNLRRGAMLAKLGRFLQAASPEARHAALHTQIHRSELLLAGSPPPLAPAGTVFRSPSLVEDLMHLDTLRYLPDDILVKVDRASMSVGLETRAPLLDHRLFEFAGRLPLEQKVRAGAGKWLLRQLLHQFVPLDLIERPKMGFCVPIGGWLRGPLRDWAEALLAESELRAQGYFNSQAVRRLWVAHCSGRCDFSFTLWTLLMFQAWNAAWAPCRAAA